MPRAASSPSCPAACRLASCCPAWQPRSGLRPEPVSGGRGEAAPPGRERRGLGAGKAEKTIRRRKTRSPGVKRRKRGGRTWSPLADSHLCIYLSTFLDHNFTYISLSLHLDLPSPPLFFLLMTTFCSSLQNMVTEHLLCGTLERETERDQR